MALSFASTNRVDCGSGSSIDNLGASTHLSWHYLTTTPTTTQILATKGGGGNAHNFNYGSAILNFVRGYATTNAVANAALSNYAAYALNKWLCAVSIYDGTNAPEIYLGSLTEPLAVPSSYTVHTAPVGALKDDSANTFYIGNGNAATFNQPLLGAVAIAGLWNRALSLGEALDQQFFPHPTSGCVGFWNLYGTGTQADYSGNANAGTVTGATSVDHVPLRLLFGRDNAALYKIIHGRIFKLAGDGGGLAGPSRGLAA